MPVRITGWLRMEKQGGRAVRRRHERVVFPHGTEGAYLAWLKERAAFWGNLRQPEPAGGNTSGVRRLA